MSKDIHVNLSHPTVSMFVGMHMTTNHPCVVKLIEMKIIPFTVLHDFAYDFIGKLMFCSTNLPCSNKKEA